MFSVIFEVNPRTTEFNTYLDIAKMLRPELEAIEGFVDNIRYKSLQRDGWILSLSGWRDEKSLVRWRTKAKHHEAQQKGRDQILQDYHLRVGQITQDTQVSAGISIAEQRLDETEVGEGTTVTLITMKRPAEFSETGNPADCAELMGLDPRADGLLDWELFDAVVTPGDLILLISWRDHASAERFEDEFTVPEGARLRRMRIVRDYAMFDRREAPQYYADAKGRESIHP
jgi:heme-degrading monooxygenase HmoA